MQNSTRLAGLFQPALPAQHTREQRILHAARPCRAPAARSLHQLCWAEVGGVARCLQGGTARRPCYMCLELRTLRASPRTVRLEDPARPAARPQLLPSRPCLQVQQRLDDGAALRGAQAALHQGAELRRQHAQHAVHIRAGAVAGRPHGLGGQARLCSGSGAAGSGMTRCSGHGCSCSLAPGRSAFPQHNHANCFLQV